MPPKKPLVIGPRPKRPPSAAATPTSTDTRAATFTRASTVTRASTSTSTTPAAPRSSTTTTTKFTSKASSKIPSKSPPSTSTSTSTTGTGTSTSTKLIPKSFPKITSKSLTTATNTIARRPPIPKCFSVRTTKSLFRKDSTTVPPTSTAPQNATQITAKPNPEFVEKFSPIHAPEILTKSESIAVPICASSECRTSPNINAPQIKCRIAPDKTRGGSVSESVEKNSQKSGTGGNEAKVCESVEKIGQEDGEGSARVNKPAVKKTVRFVRKVVKRKVPKRVEKGIDDRSDESSENQVNDEKLNLQVSVPMQDVENSESLVSSPLEVKNRNSNVLVSGQNVQNPSCPVNVTMEVEKPNPNFSVSMEEVQDSNCLMNVSMEVKNPNADLSVSMEEIENPNCAVTVSMKVTNPDNAEVCEGEQVGSVTEVPLEAQDDGDVFEKPISFNEDAPNVYAAVDGNDECVSENVQSSGRGNEGVKEEVRKCDEGGLRREGETGSGRVVLSGELEALERQRRRKTEIFIGGLDKDVNKDDIMSVFEEVGEVVEVRLIGSKTGKNKGYAFVRFASAADAKKALEKYPKIEISGKQCGTAHVEGNDTIFLGNIDKKWKNEDVIKLLQMIGIEKIDKVTVLADPNNVQRNRGFAFVEFETNKDAQSAYKKLQKKDVFGKHQNINVAWAEPLNAPDEEEMQKVKTVYVEYIPSSWDEKEVRGYFDKFGEIDNVVLARNLHSSRRKDFAFVNFTAREAALACIESLNHESLSDEGSEVNVKVSLAKPIPKGKPVKRVWNPISKEISKETMKAVQSGVEPNEPRNKGISIRKNHETREGDRSSTNAELVQLLREQASWRQSQTRLSMGSMDVEHLYFPPGVKRPLAALGEDSLYWDARGYTRACLESSFAIASPSYSRAPKDVGMTSLPYYLRQGSGSTSGYDGYADYTNSFQREEGPYHGRSGLQYRY